MILIALNKITFHAAIKIILTIFMMLCAAILADQVHAKFRCTYKGNFTFSPGDNLRPYNEVGEGDLLGSRYISATLNCGGGNPGDTFDLYLRKLSKPSAGSMCPSNWQGVGISYYDPNGRLLDCSNREEKVFTTTATGQDYQVQFQARFDLFRMNTGRPRPSGVYDLQLTHPSGVGLSYSFDNTNGIAKPYPWKYVSHSPTILLVSNCVIAKQHTSVDFGSININELNRSERPFTIGVSQCESDQTATVFNDMMKLQFSSPLLKPDGTLGLDPCPNCATGVAIQVADGNGRAIDLNKKYALNNGTFLINGTDIEHNFRATLIRDQQQPVKSGAFTSVLTFIFTSI